MTDENVSDKLNFIVNMLFDIYCHVDIHYEEMLGRKLAEAEHYGFNVERSKRWDYSMEQYTLYKPK